MGINYSPKIVNRGLVLYLDAANPRSYPGSGTTWSDLSGDGNDGVLQNGVGYDVDNNGSLTFDGQDDYISISNASSLTFTKNFTISVWFSVNDLSQGEFIQSNAAAIRMQSNSGQLYFGTKGSAGRNDFNFDTIESNLWYYYTATLSSTLSLNVYKNAQLMDTQTVTVEPTSRNLWFIGGNNYFINSKIPHCSIYNRALTAAEILQNFNATRGRYGI